MNNLVPVVWLHCFFLFFVYLFNFGCSWTTCSHAWADRQKSFGRVNRPTLVRRRPNQTDSDVTCSRSCDQGRIAKSIERHIILVAELYTTFPGKRVLVATKFNVTFLPLRLCYVNTRTCFSKDAENLTTYGYVLWCNQIICTRHDSLNTIIAFYSVIEWSNFAVSV